MVNSLCHGCEVLAINSSAAVPADGTLSPSYAIPRGGPFQVLVVSIRPTTNFTTIQVDIQFASNDVAAEYQSITSSTALAGDLLTISPVAARFMRIKLVATTGGSGLVVGITCNVK